MACLNKLLLAGSTFSLDYTKHVIRGVQLSCSVSSVTSLIQDMTDLLKETLNAWNDRTLPADCFICTADVTALYINISGP